LFFSNNPDIYKKLADLIASYQSNGEVMIDCFDNILEFILLSDVPNTNGVKILFYDIINNSRDDFYRKHRYFSRDIINFVKNMQDIIIKQYPSIDDFLAEKNIKVKVVFADISLNAGYPIDVSNIDGEVS
jgi:hypothetical protein